MNRTAKGAAIAFASFSAALTMHDADPAHAAESINANFAAHEIVLPDFVQPQRLSVVAAKTGQFILPRITYPEVDLPPRGFPSGPLEVIIDRAVAKMPVEPVAPPIPSPEQLAEYRMQEINDLATAFDQTIHGVSPEITQQAFVYLLANGLSLSGASGLWGAVIQESQGKTYAADSAGYYRGLFQWSPGRYANVGASPYDTLEEQLGKGLWEMKHRYPRTYAVLTDNDASIEYSILAMHWFEGESIPGGRAGFSRQLFRAANNGYSRREYIFYQPGGGNELL